MTERQARPCMNLFGMYRLFGVVPRGLVVFLLFFLFGDFQGLFLGFSVGSFGAFL
jgi:hypothetical protein